VPQVITDVRPSWVIPGGRVVVTGVHLPMPGDGPPHVLVGDRDAAVVAASHRRLRFVVPPDAAGGRMPVRIDELPGETAYLDVARVLASEVHQVDNPAFDGAGRLVVTHSGSRGMRVATPLYRFDTDGTRTALAVEVGNPTSMALGPDGALYISSRFDGHVYRLNPDDTVEQYASELGVATGLAFGPDGSLFVGDRSGTITRISSDRDVEEFASLPASIAAFHLAFGPGGHLYVSAPTLSSQDPIYRITPDRLVDTLPARFGRPQGIAFDDTGMLYVADALAGAAGLYRLDVHRPDATPELVVAAPALVGLAFDPEGGLVLASNETVWRLDVPVTPWRA